MPEAAAVHGAGDVRGPDAWFRELPLVTKYWFGGAMFCTLAVNFDIISASLIPFVWKNVSSKLELWRLLSCFLYVGPVCCELRTKRRTQALHVWVDNDDLFLTFVSFFKLSV